ncbi:hypothetical protein CYLTODRAFT_424807 [Cylindrobasidium torrendii FP15055 ss-10]|uniref:Uncharacterized protein n=1 Tax=Cylindrobasidium torrendii FP15055 ss-10 TaxID=1314674 RepID=A0A0D7B406_9AGAR|nr:hypothetical protein CYLTODRAFT_424807 [Cylindrobasidium torrendii FP15055 ss-10]
MLYRAEDFSLSDTFSTDDIQVSVVYSQGPTVQDLESFGGLHRHEFFRKLQRSQLNTLKVQPDVANLFGRAAVAFIPAERTLVDILEFYKMNHICPISERKRFDEVPHLQTSTYTLGVDPYFKRDLFTRHPLTGKVTRHRHPYTALPKFTLPIHPCIAVATAIFLIDLCSDAPPISDTLLAIGRLHAFNSFWARIPKYSSAKSVTSTSSTRSSSSSNSSQSSVSSRSHCSTQSSHTSCSSPSSSPNASCPEKRRRDIDFTGTPPRATKIQRREPSAASVSLVAKTSSSNCAKVTKRPLGHDHCNIRSAHSPRVIGSTDPRNCSHHSPVSKKLLQRRCIPAPSRRIDSLHRHIPV